MTFSSTDQTSGTDNHPAWHAEALKDAERLLKEGKAKFMNWEDAKKELRRRLE